MNHLGLKIYLDDPQNDGPWWRAWVAGPEKYAAMSRSVEGHVRIVPWMERLVPFNLVLIDSMHIAQTHLKGMPG